MLKHKYQVQWNPNNSKQKKLSGNWFFIRKMFFFLMIFHLLCDATRFYLWISFKNYFLLLGWIIVFYHYSFFMGHLNTGFTEFIWSKYSLLSPGQYGQHSPGIFFCCSDGHFRSVQKFRHAILPSLHVQSEQPIRFFTPSSYSVPFM